MEYSNTDVEDPAIVPVTYEVPAFKLKKTLTIKLPTIPLPATLVNGNPFSVNVLALEPPVFVATVKSK